MGAQALPPVERARDYEALARAQVDEAVWRYLQDGNSLPNEQALAAVRLMPRPLRRVTGGHTRLHLLGQDLAHPLLMAPLAYQRLCHREGEVGSAMAVAAQGGSMAISSLASQSLADIVQASREAGGAPPWFQLYWQQDRPRTLRLLRLAEAAGCHAVVFTVDAPIKLATMQLPVDLKAVNLEAPAPLPAWPAGHSAVFDGWMAQAPDWSDLAWLRTQTRLPLLLKGVLHPDDAERAVAAGCDGVVVSNHGGRVLAGAPSSLWALQQVRARLGPEVPIVFDSGVRSGRDAFVALAHGARAVMVGRPCLWGLASHGAMGVAHVLRLLRDELEMSMALTGCATLADIDSRAIAV